MSTTSTAISAQGCSLKIATGSASGVSITGVTVGYPTKITAAGFSNGDKVTLAGLTGADAATLNTTAVVKYAKSGYFYVDIDTTGMTITTSGTPTATATTYTAVANLKSFSGLDGSASDIDITHLDSAAKEFRAGLVDNGSFSTEVDRDTSDAGQLACTAAQTAGATKAFKLTLSNGVIASFNAYVKKFNLSGQVDGVYKSSLELKVTGAVTWA